VKLPYYLDNDLKALLRRAPYLTLAKPSGLAERFLEKVADAGERHREILKNCEHVRIEPLDFYYFCLTNLGALTLELVEDLCTYCNWRGVVWASWMVCLSPLADYRRPLKDARLGAPHNQWIVDLALAETEGVEVPGFKRFHGYVRTIRSLLASLPRPASVLRRGPDEAGVSRLRFQAEWIRSEYRRGGLEVARAAIKASFWPRYL
jgi:hypothetical protein